MSYADDFAMSMLCLLLGVALGYVIAVAERGTGGYQPRPTGKGRPNPPPRDP